MLKLRMLVSLLFLSFLVVDRAQADDVSDFILNIRLASFNTAKATDSIPGVLVFITKGEAIVQVTSLGELSEKMDRKTEKFENEKKILGILNPLASNIQPEN